MKFLRNGRGNIGRSSRTSERAKCRSERPVERQDAGQLVGGTSRAIRNSRRQERRVPSLNESARCIERFVRGVHPDDAYAQQYENGELGKTECWYILDAEPGAEIVYGHTAKTREELTRIIRRRPLGRAVMQGEG